MLRRLSLVLTIGALQSCQCGTGVSGHDYACGTSDDCITGFLCFEGVCITREAFFEKMKDAGVDAGDDGGSIEPQPDGGDGGAPDSGEPDAGPPDAGPPDAGPPDAGRPDAGKPDAGPPDAGPPDAGCDAGMGIEACGDGIDNNCNGLVDCAESTCAMLSCGPNGLACSGMMCICSGNGGMAQASESACSDLHDNDCDGLVDCADSQCAGQSCAPNGKVCMGSTCVCTGNGGTAQASESACSDAHDNDCDGLTDCADSSCTGLSCGANGRTCAGSSCTCSGNGGTAQATETSCTDGFDNDCDGLIDCADSNCNGASCGANGRTCSAGACNCSGNGGTAQASELTCNDAHDNDCDGLVDCADSTCAGLTCGANGRTCAGTSCTCSGNGGTVQTAETICSDAHDNDCNGLTDCAEPACAGQVCGAFGRSCVGTTCTCSGNGGVAQALETSCMDGFDNDCDGLIDMADPNCVVPSDGGTYVLSTSPQVYIDACTQTGFTRQTFMNPDDEATPVLTLPIPFQFYHQPVTQYWFSTNGMIGFNASPSSTLSSVCLPGTTNPRPGLYVFLDDLVTTNGICTVVTGVAPNRKLIITWPAVDSFNYGPVSMNFSAFLSETTNTIDVVFGSMPTQMNKANARGLDALTGVMNTAGDRATQYACHTSGYATSNLGIRFTPQ